VIDWGTFTWVVMPFGVKKEPPTYQKIVNRDFKKYLDQFMKIFMDDFTVYNDMDDFIIYNDMDNHLSKLKLCFEKCKKFKINFNLENVLLWSSLEQFWGLFCPRNVNY
jgi:hypothetical protein